MLCLVEPVMGGLGLNWTICFLNPSFHFNFTHFWFLEASSFFFRSRLNFKLFSAFHALIAYTNVDSETEDTSQWEDCRGWERCSCWYPNEWFVAEMLMWPLVRQLLMRHLKLHATILWFDCWLHCKLYFMGNGILDLIYWKVLILSFHMYHVIVSMEFPKSRSSFITKYVKSHEKYL